MARFTLPRDLYHGKGALEALKTFKGKKAIICVGGGSMKRFGFLQKAEDYLKEAGMEVKLFEGIEPDPSVETVMKGAAVMQEFEPDWIVAMGGGSPIDAAKAMWIKYEYPDITFEDMCKVFGIPALRNKAHFCAISSTSGTATEVTAFSIITDYEKGIKYPHPSNFAASIRSSGIPIRFCRRKKIILTFPKHPGIISGSRVLVQPSLVNMTYCGIMTTANGIIMVASNARNNAFLPRNLIFANPNAAREEVNPPIINTGIATFRELNIPFMNCPFFNTSEYFPIRIGSGRIVNVPDKI